MICVLTSTYTQLERVQTHETCRIEIVPINCSCRHSSIHFTSQTISINYVEFILHISNRERIGMNSALGKLISKLETEVFEWNLIMCC